MNLRYLGHHVVVDNQSYYDGYLGHADFTEEGLRQIENFLVTLKELAQA